ncbi:hypothetical protein [Lysobacter terrae]
MNKTALVAGVALTLIANLAFADNSSNQVGFKRDTTIAAPPSCLPGQTLIPIYSATGRIIGWKCVGNA